MPSDAGDAVLAEVWAGIIEALADVKTVPPSIALSAATRLEADLGIGSYDLLNMVFFLEERFDINILQALPKSLVTLGQAQDLVAGLVAAKRAETA